MISWMPVPSRLREALTPFPAVRLAVLFGSAARGRETARSDVDVGVLLAEGNADALWDIETALGEALRRQIDLIDLRRAPPLLRLEIARDGVVLVEREPGSWTRFKARAMLDWWDWAPTARKIQHIAATRLKEELAHGQA